MSYQVWSVVFGEQPSASKWNILGSNDASFNDGTGIADEAIIARHIGENQIDTKKLSLSVAFRAYRSSAWTTSTTATKVTFNTENYDISNNFDTAQSRFTAPEKGIYLFGANIGFANMTSEGVVINLYKNGAQDVILLNHQVTTPNTGWQQSKGGVTALSLNAGDYVEVYLLTSSAVTGGTGNPYTYFWGLLLAEIT